MIMEVNLINASEAEKLLDRQMESWELARNNFKALENVRTKSFDMGGFSIVAQFNPARAISTGAKVDANSIKKRKCFLCESNLPKVQIRMPLGSDHLLLCNPYPIFRHHYTIPSRLHTDQLIMSQIDKFVEITKMLSPFTIFYNGPRSGASAPDHAHFQAVTRGVMPIDNDVIDIIKRLSGKKESHICVEGKDQHDEGIYLLKHYLRNGFIINTSDAERASALFKAIYKSLETPPGEEEPMMNIFGSFIKGRWIITVVPRKQHRPWQYEAEGDDHLMSSPGAADIGGLFITPLEKDFNKIDVALLRDVYQQVCYSDKEVEEIFVHLR